MITYPAPQQALTAPIAKAIDWKALIRRAFELAGAPYANSPYMPL